MTTYTIIERAYPTILIRNEIEKLRASKDVKLAKLELNLSSREKQKLSTLRSMQKRGKQLRADGFDEEKLRAYYSMSGNNE